MKRPIPPRKREKRDPGTAGFAPEFTNVPTGAAASRGKRQMLEHRTSIPVRSFRRVVRTSWVASVMFASSFGVAAAAPKSGEPAPNFSLRTLDDRVVELSSLVQDGPVVLVVLRGWPGYQCPLCTRQVHDFVNGAARFRGKNARVVMVYPGPAEELKIHAREFLHDKTWPAEFFFVLDPDYTFSNAYGLRWDAKKETVYPSTFVIERGGRINFAHVSRSHGNRLSVARAMVELEKGGAIQTVPRR
jgi:peroxiredoxin Q/BCP